MPPPLPCDPASLIRIDDLDDLAQIAFRGMESLNRLQSELFACAYKSSENMLVCAPTAAGKTNVAMLALLHALRLNAYPFASLNGIWNRGLNAFDYATLQRFWHEDVGGDDLGALPADINEGFRFMCCAQFIVARERLVARPRATYRRFLAALRDMRALLKSGFAP